jgi:hypothetical protein
MRRGEPSFPFSVLTNSLTTLEESLALAIDFEEIDSCGRRPFGEQGTTWTEG